MEYFEQITNLIVQHWPGLAWLGICALIGRVMNKSVFTHAQAHKKGKYQWFWWWGRKSLTLHPVAAGALLGIWWKNPEGAVPAWPTIASMVYFGFFGGFSVWVYETAKNLLKKKGIDLEAALDSTPPPAPGE